MDWQTYLLGNKDTGQQGLVKNPVDQMKQTWAQSPANRLVQGLKGMGQAKTSPGQVCPDCGKSMDEEQPEGDGM